MQCNVASALLGSALLVGVASASPVTSVFVAAQASGSLGPGVPNFWVRPGYRVDLLATVPNARFVEFGGDPNTLYVSRPDRGDIITLKRANGGAFTTQRTLISGQPTVHGMDYEHDWLYFTQSGTIKRTRDANNDGVTDMTVTIAAGLPSGGGHYLRSILVTAHGIWTSIGDSSNASDERATDRQKIWHYDLNGGSKTLWATGLRNTEKLRLRPGTTQIYGADHGSDNWGAEFGETSTAKPFTDVNQPEEFNLYESGKFYGHPFLVGDRVPRPEYSRRTDLVELGLATQIPAWKFGAHWAPNGFAFSEDRSTGPSSFGYGDAYVAMHGSWNSSVKVGYRIERVLFDPVFGKPMGSQPMVMTVRDGTVLGRPVDVARDPLGGLVFSDDATGRIYGLRAASDIR